jgi:P-type conjugative transfer protein VirB9
MKGLLAFLAGIACAMSVWTTASAEIKPIPMPADSKLVEFPYDPNDTFIVLTRPKAVTDIVLHPDEEIQGLALGDTSQWIVKDTKGHIFIKPIRPNIATTATLVTTARTYQFTLQSSPEDGIFYQRVGFTYPQLVIIERERQEAARGVREAERARLDAQIASPRLSPENLNFEYNVSGDAKFKPEQVFDDGKFTWLKMPKSQEAPIVFLVAEDGSLELINATPKGDFVIVQRLVDKLLLRIGKSEVTIERKGTGGWSLFK